MAIEPLITALRAGHQYSGIVDPLDVEAADLIERQADEIAILRAALKSILDRYEDQNISHIDFRVGAQRVAASALLRNNEQIVGEKNGND